MYITSKEVDALQKAIDFIGTNSDAADDHEPYQEMMGTLRKIWKKGLKQVVKREKTKK